MFKWIRRNICCCIPKHTITSEKSILVKNKKQPKENNSNRNNKKVSFDIKNYNYLETITYKDTEAFIPQIRFAKVIKVYDGDTITVAAKLPFNESAIYRFSVRLRSIDSPEIKGESEKECQLAIVARDALHHFIFGKIIELRHHGKEKYGRLLADIYYKDVHINKWMVDKGYAVKYDGGRKVRGDGWD
jgi:endonuclease YncB( thermonuclease family)